MKLVKVLAIIVLALGLPTMGFLTFFVAMICLFSIFTAPPVGRQIAGYLSLAGPIPLLTGGILLLFSRTQKPGARWALAGSFIMSVYLVVCYSALNVYDVKPLAERILWFGAVPLAVLAVDYTSYRAYLAVKGRDQEDRSRRNAVAS